MGLAFKASSTPPDLLVTADGRHLAVQVPGGGLAILRARAGDYVRDTLSESAGFEGELVNIEDLPHARCSADLCAINIVADDRNWRVLATRGGYMLPWRVLTAQCRQADKIGRAHVCTPVTHAPLVWRL